MSKRTLDSFFSPTTKKIKQSTQDVLDHGPSQQKEIKASQALVADASHHSLPKSISTTSHATYAFPIADLPSTISEELDELLLTASGKMIKNQPHLDLLYFEPLIPRSVADELFQFLRSALPFYRVKYTINRFGKSLDINTPRYTTVFGIDETSRFLETIASFPEDSKTNLMSTRIVEASNRLNEVAPGKYKSCVVPPRPIPPCLSVLKNLTEALTSDTYNFVLVNYYADGKDSISFHSDDERFLGDHPTIASFSLGARRDFLMKHKPPGAGPGNGNRGGKSSTNDDNNDNDTNEKIYPGTSPIKLALGSGDMILMRGETQRNWLHSIPKRTGKNTGGVGDNGRINITMRKALVPGGTENYYRYNVGAGPVYRWDDRRREMRLWEEPKLEKCR